MKKYRIEIKWAFIFIGTTLLWMIFERVAGFHDKHIDKHAVVTNFFFIPAILVYVFALLDKRKNFYDNNISWKQGFISGVIIGLIVGMLTPLNQLIVSYVISPHYFQNAIQYAVENGKSSLEEAQQYFNIKNFIITSTIFAPIAGVVTAAIVAIFVRKKA